MKKLTWLFSAMLMSGVTFVTQAQDTSSIKAQLDYTPGEPTMLIWWDANDEDYVMYNKGSLEFVGGRETLTAVYNKNFVEDDDLTGVIVKLETIGLTDGVEYTINIPADFVTGYLGEFPGNNAESVTFTYKAPVYTYMSPATITSTMSGSVDELIPVQLNWGGQHVSRSINEYSCIIRNLTTGDSIVNTSQGLFRFLNEEGKELASTFNGTWFQVNMTSKITEKDCAYQLVLPARIVVNDEGEYNPEQVIAEFVYGQLPGPKAQVDYTPGEPTMLIWWDANDEDYVMYNKGSLEFVGGGETLTAVYNKNFVEDDDLTGVIVKLETIGLTDGVEYTINIPADFVTGYLGEFPGNNAESVTFTYKAPVYTYMSPATITSTMNGAVDELIPVQLNWGGQHVSRSINEYSCIIRNLTTGDSIVNTSQGFFKFLDEEGTELKNTFNGTWFQVNMTSKITEKDCAYQLVLPARIVVNDEGEYNPEQVIAEFYYGELPGIKAQVDYTPGEPTMLIWWDTNEEDYVMYNKGTLEFVGGGETITAVYRTNFEEDDDLTGVIVKLESIGLTDGVEYTINIPDQFVVGYLGAFEGNSAESVSFTYKAPVYVYMDPATVTSTMSGPVDALSVVKLNWGGQHVSRSINQYSCIIRNLTTGEDITNTSQGLFRFLDDEGNVLASTFNGTWFQVDMTSKITEKDCNYQLILPARIVVNDEGEYNPEQVIAEFYYGELPGTMEAMATLLYPESEYVTGCGYAQVTWEQQPVTLVDPNLIKVVINNEVYTTENGIEISMTDTAGSGEPEVGPLADDEEGEAGEDEPKTGDTLVITLPFDAFFSWETFQNIPGTYQFIIQEGAVKNEAGEVNADESFTVNVLETKAATTVTPTPDSTVAELEDITLAWENLTVKFNVSEQSVRLQTPDWNVIDLVEEDLVKIDGNIVLINVADYTEEDGTYALIVVGGAFLLGNNQYLNDDGYYEFTVSGNSGIANFVDAVDGKYVVYTIDGLLITVTEKAEDLKALESGRMYIINGKKVLVRK